MAEELAEKIRAWQAEVEQIRSELERLRFQLAVKEAALQLVSPYAPTTTPSDVPSTKTPGNGGFRRAGMLEPNSIVRQIVVFMRDHKSPVRARFVADKLAAAGVIPSGKRPLKSIVSAALSHRLELFARKSRGLYVLKEAAQSVSGPQEGAAGNGE